MFPMYTFCGYSVTDVGTGLQDASSYVPVCITVQALASPGWFQRKCLKRSHFWIWHIKLLLGPLSQSLDFICITIKHLSHLMKDHFVLVVLEQVFRFLSCLCCNISFLLLPPWNARQEHCVWHSWFLRILLTPRDTDSVSKWTLDGGTLIFLNLNYIISGTLKQFWKQYFAMSFLWSVCTFKSKVLHLFW